MESFNDDVYGALTPNTHERKVAMPKVKVQKRRTPILTPNPDGSNKSRTVLKPLALKKFRPPCKL